MGFAGLLAVALIGYLIFRSVYTSTSHSRLPQGSLDISAVPKIAGSKIVGLKGEKTYETTVVFDDGFEFISHRSNRADRFATYTISLTGEIRNKILADAVKAHTDAYVNEQKRNNNTIPEVVAFAFANVSEWEKYKNKYAKDLIVSWKWKDEYKGFIINAEGYLSRGDYTNALKKYEDALKMNPVGIAARFGIVRTYIESGDYTEAETTLRKMMDLIYYKSDASNFYLLFGKLMQKRGFLNSCVASCILSNMQKENWETKSLLKEISVDDQWSLTDVIERCEQEIPILKMDEERMSAVFAKAGKARRTSTASGSAPVIKTANDENSAANKTPKLPNSSISNNPPKQTTGQDIKFCRKCGFRLAPGSVFCSKCGTKI